jgi:quercetin dioxygenase-like cupin family protein
MGDTKAWAEIEERTIIPGFHGRFIHSAEMTFALWRIEAGATLPLHQHLHEQVVHVFSGELEIVVEGVAHRVTPGTVLVIPPHAWHEGRALAEASVMDVFSPVREDYRDGGETVLGKAGRG